MQLKPDYLKSLWNDLAAQCDPCSQIKTVLLVGAEGRTEHTGDQKVIYTLSPNDLSYLRTTAELLNKNRTPLSDQFEIVVVNPIFGGSDFQNSEQNGDVAIFCFIDERQPRIINPENMRKEAIGYNDSAVLSGAKYLTTIGQPYENQEIGPQDFPSFKQISVVEVPKKNPNDSTQVCCLLEKS